MVTVQIILTLCGLLLGICCGQLASAESPSGPIEFNRHVRPILTQHCLSCHGGVKQAAGISFAYEEDLLSVVEPGSADDSYFMERIVTEDDSFRMPPADHGPPLASSDVDILRRWIDSGAVWSKHWAYKPPQRYETLDDPTNGWSHQPIDRFVFDHLASLDIDPAEEERPDRWLRRASLDLTGLPPTVEERARFLTDVSANIEQAYEEAVDRLLASDRFGERWASVWFDLVRYADSCGLSEDSPRDVWKYRDWVIDALNDDLPFDDFTRKQIAGDLLPNRSIEDHLATGMHRLTASNEEGGTDDEEFRVAAVLDRVDTIWQVWQGTTMGCVQCHDHPYDPIGHHEFYRFMALFNNTADCDLTGGWPLIDVPLDEEAYARASELDRKIRELQTKLWEHDWQTAHLDSDWKTAQILEASTSNPTRLTVKSSEGVSRYRTVGTVASRPVVTVKLAVPAEIDRVTGIRITALPLEEETARKDAEVGFVMSEITVLVNEDSNRKAVTIPMAEVIGDEPEPYTNPQRSLNNDNEGFGAFTRVHHPRNVVLLPESPIETKGGSTLVVKVRYGVFDLAAFSLVARSGQFALSSDSRLVEMRNDQRRTEEFRQLSELRKSRDRIPSVGTPVLVERPDHLARPAHRFERGLFLTKAEQVKPGVPNIFNSSDPQVSDRLALADWLVSDANPLTARVMVNRLWARLFGVGLVPTEGDFGSAGDMPSHPELLDDLAVRFRDDYQWSIKRLLRELVLSSTYRQSSRVATEHHRIDPRNRNLARGPRHALPAEMVRDQMLAISGLLVNDMKGPPVFPPIPDGVWNARRGSWKEHSVGDPNRYRRSVYTYVKRSVPYPLFTTFDAPSRDICVTNRLRSNTPLQSLMLLNDEAAYECANAFAGVMQQHSDSLEEQIRYGFLRATVREIAQPELKRLLDLHADTASTTDPETALQTVAAVLLNLDEVINK